MKRFAIIFSIMICTCILLSPLSGYAVESSPKISDREIIESLTRLEEGIKMNKELIGTLRSDIGLLRSDIGVLRVEIIGFMKWGFGLLFSGMLILVGFILWDRKSTLKPVKDELDELERRKVDRLIAAMKKLSEDDSRIAQVLRSVGLL
jgi:hypothetical protein